MKKKGIARERDHVLAFLETQDPSSEKYSTAASNLQVLSESQSRLRIDPGVIVGAIVNVVGILLILRFERFDVVSSKAITFIKKIF